MSILGPNNKLHLFTYYCLYRHLSLNVYIGAERFNILPYNASSIYASLYISIVKRRNKSYTFFAYYCLYRRLSLHVHFGAQNLVIYYTFFRLYIPVSLYVYILREISHILACNTAYIDPSLYVSVVERMK
jgi:hypothetical protein